MIAEFLRKLASLLDGKTVTYTSTNEFVSEEARAHLDKMWLHFDASFQEMHKMFDALRKTK
jgi:hypothetical protein